MFKNIKRLASKYSPFKENDKISELASSISDGVKTATLCYEDRLTSIENYKKALIKERREREKEQSLFISVIDHIDDMIWAKDLDSRYIMANKVFREKFCYGLPWKNIKGKTDEELSVLLKRIAGEENHTLGDVVNGTDEKVINTELPQQFFEQGKLDGKLIKLVVQKSPVFDFKGTMFAVCGTGKDITRWHDDLERIISENKSFFGEYGSEVLKEQLNKVDPKESNNARNN